MKKIFPHLSFILIFATLLTLGFWQLERLKWKTTEINKLEHNLSYDIAPLDTLTEEGRLQYRKVVIEGEFLHEYELYLYAGQVEIRSKPGYMVVTPLRLEDETIILVNRGFVIEKLQLPENRPESLTKEKVSLEGYIMKAENPNRFTPKNDFGRKLIFYIDPEEINRNFGFENGHEYFILAAPYSDESIIFQGRKLSPSIRNDHLQYAITWFTLAFASIVIYSLYCIRPLRKLAAEDEMRGDSDRRTGVYMSVHEDSSTESTKQFSSAVEFPKRSIKKKRKKSDR